jgi:nitrogen fixation protein FixH
MTDARSIRTRRPPREPWPYALAGLLLGMIGISIAFYAVAAHYPDAEVVPDLHAAGQQYNHELDLRREAHASGLSLGVETETRAGGVWVEVSVRDASSAAVRFEEVRVRRIRPAEGGYDADFALEGAAGFVPLPLPGRWRLEAQARVGDRVLHRELSLFAAGER